MASTAQSNASKRYIDKQDDIKFRVPKGTRELYKAYAATQGKSLNAYIVDLIEADMKRVPTDSVD